MLEQNWANEFAILLATKLGDEVCQFHRDVAEYWADEIDADDPMTPGQAVDEELSAWGD